MKANTRIAVILTTGCALMLMMPLRTASADSFKDLSAEWWQWALSIPTPVNPQLDTTGVNAVVGQHGQVWFLAGFFGGTPEDGVTRKCSVPEGTALFFPVTNSVTIDTPGVCGQDESLSVEELRDASAGVVDGATNLSVTVDGVRIKNLRRVQSRVFAVALPDDNVFDAPCASVGDVPAGIYSPAVDDGFYVLLDKLSAGEHTLHFHAEDSSGVVQDVTYDLTVVPVSTK